MKQSKLGVNAMKLFLLNGKERKITTNFHINEKKKRILNLMLNIKKFSHKCLRNSIKYV
jgi:hypothetical protein